jgi:hypothetical protein
MPRYLVCTDAAVSYASLDAAMEAARLLAGKNLEAVVVVAEVVKRVRADVRIKEVDADR